MTLAQKLHPGRYTEMSAKMAAIVGYVVGEEWTTPTINSLAITSDGFVVSMNNFIGTASDLEQNVGRLLDMADLTDEELAEWEHLYQMKVTDWRQRDN